jgi:hypothetical protein
MRKTFAELSGRSAAGSSSLHIDRDDRCAIFPSGLTTVVACTLARRFTVVLRKRVDDGDGAFVNVLDTTWIRVSTASLVDDRNGALVDVDGLDYWRAPIRVTRLRDIKIAVVVGGVMCCVRRCRCGAVGGNDWNGKVSVPTIYGKATGQRCGITHFIWREWNPRNDAAVL